MKLSGNTILVAGGTSGIGLGLALRLRHAGNRVIVAGRRRELLESIVTEFEGIESIYLDVTDPDSIVAAYEQVAGEYPRLNVLINMAGIMVPEDLLDPSSLEVAEQTVVTNLLGPIRTISAFLPLLTSQTDAAIMTVSSGLAFVPLPVTPTYSATKAAIHSYSESLRVQLRDTSVEVIELVPPGVRTALFGQEEAGTGMPLEDFLDEVMATISADAAVREILVEDVKYLRFAEATGDYPAALAMLSGD
jgi:short-subunit dehydrogenase involved in D-alanine esterification of teichoic acids